MLLLPRMGSRLRKIGSESLTRERMDVIPEDAVVVYARGGTKCRRVQAEHALGVGHSGDGDAEREKDEKRGIGLMSTEWERVVWWSQRMATDGDVIREGEDLEISKDMTRAFDVIEDETQAVLTSVLKCITGSWTGQYVEVKTRWKLGPQTACGRSRSHSSHHLGCLVHWYRKGCEGADGRTKRVDWSGLFGKVERNLLEAGRNGTSSTVPGVCCASLEKPGSLPQLALLKAQVDGLQCAYSYMTLVVLLVVVGCEDTAKKCSERMVSLWRRVRRLLEVGMDVPELAAWDGHPVEDMGTYTRCETQSSLSSVDR